MRLAIGILWFVTLTSPQTLWANDAALVTTSVGLNQSHHRFTLAPEGILSPWAGGGVHAEYALRLSSTSSWSIGVSIGYSETTAFMEGFGRALGEGIARVVVGGAITGLLPEKISREVQESREPESLPENSKARFMPVHSVLMVRDYEGSFHPYAALSLGVTHAAWSKVDSATNAVNDGSGVFVTGAARAGMDIDLANHFAFTIEPMSFNYLYDNTVAWTPKAGASVLF
ncbi:hypothetical protein K2X33_01325 [bacterium]|nr:hypothetical protein [bacterium]